MQSMREVHVETPAASLPALFSCARTAGVQPVSARFQGPVVLLRFCGEVAAVETFVASSAAVADIRHVGPADFS